MFRRVIIAGGLLTLILPLQQVLAWNAPAYEGFITDTVGILSEEEASSLERSLEDYKVKTSNEIAVLIVPTLDGEPIADAAIETGREWGIGTEEHNNGILILIATEDRELFIATGYGLEGAVPDIVAKGVIDEEITPYFQDGNYAAGITAGISALIKHIGGEYTADRYDNGGDQFPHILIFMIIILFQWSVAILGRTKSWWLGGVFGGIAGVIVWVMISWAIAIPILVMIGLLLDYFVSKNYKKSGKTSFWAGGGWGPGGSGGGGFSGFSGGSFGGGGAGGRW